MGDGYPRPVSPPLLALALLLWGGAAQADGRFTPALPATELPVGVVTVKVVGKGMSDTRVGQPVTLKRGAAVVTTARSAKDGRARFEKLEAGATYTLTAGNARSQPFQVPAAGGLRFLLFLEAQLSAMTGGAGPSGGKMPGGHPPVSGTAPRSSASQGAATVETDRGQASGQVLVLVVKGARKVPLAGVKVVVVGQAQIQVVKGHPVVAPTAGRRLITNKKGVGQITLPAAKKGDEPVVFLVAHAGLTYRSSGLVPGAEHGHRVTFQVYDRTSDTATLKLGVQLLSRVTEGAVSFMLAASLNNSGDAIVHPGNTGLKLPLPEGATSVTVHRAYRDLVHLDEARKELRLLTPIPPGVQEVRYFFELPTHGAELELRMKLPLASSTGRASVLGTASVKLAGPAVTGSGEHTLKDSTEKQRVYQLAPLAAGSLLEITFTGLPHHGKGTTVALVIALSAALALAGVFAALGGARKARARQARRELLLDQLARLEGAQGKDRPGDKRARLIKELRELWDR